MPLTLGPLERDHLPLLQEWRNSPAVQAHVRHPGLVSMADQEAWYQRLTTATDTKMWMASYEKRFVGIGGLCYIDLATRSAELSVHAERGYAPSGESFDLAILRLLISIAFEELGLHRVWAECLTPERAALFQERGLGAVGRIPDAHFRNGRWIPSTLFSMTEREWRTP